MLSKLFSGTFSYKEYKKSYTCSKFNREIDIIENYLCQLPVIKIIGIPIATVMILSEWAPALISVILETVAYKIKKQLKVKND